MSIFIFRKEKIYFFLSLAQFNNFMAWTEIIEPKKKFFDLKIKEVWKYRDLLVMFIQRDFVATYKQTILGPLWFFIQPMLMTLMFTIVFGKFARISTDGLPQILFYLSGITIWNYFSNGINAFQIPFTGISSIHSVKDI